MIFPRVNARIRLLNCDGNTFNMIWQISGAQRFTDAPENAIEVNYMIVDGDDTTQPALDGII